MFIPAAKEYEKPEPGIHLAVLVDVVDLGQITSNFNGQVRSYPAIRFIWSLATLGKDGRPLQVWGKKLNASSWHEKGNLYKFVKQVLGTPPTPATDPESLIGQVRQLFVSRNKSADGTKDYVNIEGIAPAPGAVLPIPADYVREKFRPKTAAGPNGQPVQTYSQPPAAVASQASQAQVNTQLPPGFQSVQGPDVRF
jgi:hypothetical protein